MAGTAVEQATIDDATMMPCATCAWEPWSRLYSSAVLRPFSCVAGDGGAGGNVSRECGSPDPSCTRQLFSDHSLVLQEMVGLVGMCHVSVGAGLGLVQALVPLVALCCSARCCAGCCCPSINQVTHFFLVRHFPFFFIITSPENS